jgi:hypothetical protein
MWHFCRQLMTGRWFSPVSPTNKTDRHSNYSWNIDGNGVKHHNPNPIEMVFENEEEIHFHGTICYCISFSLQIVLHS